jgi:hypothetical protein
VRGVEVARNCVTWRTLAESEFAAWPGLAPGHLDYFSCAWNFVIAGTSPDKPGDDAG